MNAWPICTGVATVICANIAHCGLEKQVDRRGTASKLPASGFLVVKSLPSTGTCIPWGSAPRRHNLECPFFGRGDSVSPGPIWRTCEGKGTRATRLLLVQSCRRVQKEGSRRLGYGTSAREEPARCRAPTGILSVPSTAVCAKLIRRQPGASQMHSDITIIFRASGPDSEKELGGAGTPRALRTAAAPHPMWPRESHRPIAW